MPKKFLYSPDIVACLEKMSRETVPEGVAGGPFCEARGSDGVMNGSLNEALIKMVPSLEAGLDIPPAVLLRENPLPAPLSSGVWVFPFKGSG